VLMQAMSPDGLEIKPKMAS
jgi:hypothetical protein